MYDKTFMFGYICNKITPKVAHTHTHTRVKKLFIPASWLPPVMAKKRKPRPVLFGLLRDLSLRLFRNFVVLFFLNSVCDTDHALGRAENNDVVLLGINGEWERLEGGKRERRRQRDSNLDAEIEQLGVVSPAERPVDGAVLHGDETSRGQESRIGRNGYLDAIKSGASMNYSL